MIEDRFDDQTFRALMDGLRRTHDLVRFVDLATASPARYVLLRHDVDYSPRAALRLAEKEAEMGLKATYFLLVGCLYYSLLDPRHATFPRDLVALGHEVGLHYDVNAFSGRPRGKWEDILASEARLLGDLAGAPVRSIAMHQPGLNGADPFRRVDTGFFNAYSDEYFKDIRYISDSCRAWRDESWRLLRNGPLPDRIQLALHPVNWSAEDRERTTIFKDAHRETRAAIEEAENVLLDQISRHEAVRQHEARRLGSPSRPPSS